MNDQVPPLLVFADDWGRHPSSCQHLIRRLRADYRVLWANSIGTRQPQWNAFTMRRGVEKLRQWSKGTEQVAPQMWVTDLPMLPFARGRWLQWLNNRCVGGRLRAITDRLGHRRPIVVTTLPYILPWIERLERCALVYYVTDDYSEWPGADRAALVQADRQMAETADLIVAVSHSLQSKYDGHPNCTYMPHGVDVQHFAQAQTAPLPATYHNLPSPRIGFFGLIYEKLDFALLRDVANKFPQTSLIMIGPNAFCDEQFAQLPNVHFVGPQPYDSLPGWIAGLDVLLLPYVLDEMIVKSCPLKLRECLASGKPTVSVDVPEVRRLMPYVRVGENRESFLQQIESILQSTESAEAARNRQRQVAEDDWSCRARHLGTLLQALR